MAVLTPATTDFIESAGYRVTTDVDIAATPDEIWAVLTDNERWPDWFPAAKACRSTSDVATGVGSTRWMHFGPFKLNERFVAWDEPREWAFTGLDANLPGIRSLVERATIESIDATTSALTYVLAFDLGPFLRPAAPILRWRMGMLFRQGLGAIEAQVAKLRTEST
jgi:uncharacterized protein YndB with AHSA1/START domain